MNITTKYIFRFYEKDFIEKNLKIESLDRELIINNIELNINNKYDIINYIKRNYIKNFFNYVLENKYIYIHLTFN